MIVRRRGAPSPDWHGTFDQVLVSGTFLSEAVFFHRATATLIENFEPRRVILAHGRCIEDDATAELEPSLAWTGVGDS